MPDLRVLMVRNVRAASQCSACGTSKDIEFHHVRSKRFTLGDHSIIRRVPLHVVIEEIERCIPLCHSCHMHLHQGELCVNIKQSSHTHLAVVHAVRVMLGTKPKTVKSRTKQKSRRKPRRNP